MTLLAFVLALTVCAGPFLAVMQRVAAQLDARDARDAEADLHCGAEQYRQVVLRVQLGCGLVLLVLGWLQWRSYSDIAPLILMFAGAMMTGSSAYLVVHNRRRRR
ncbi:hypothetical protein MBOU_57750 [Mycobacterium bourgelatii]|uniref:Uncharacterized protein n=1 Tax=Mycobacterium bourgelatii TaxID=1273442 RepID=A0A7I9YYP4_MYCBU|nr:hypothetical protein MBOU_57750 [Mycobacterium bourgelatii]